MRKLTFFLLGQKGYEVLRAVISAGEKDMVRLVVIGSDSNLQKDFFSDIQSLCAEHHIKYCERNEASDVMKGVGSSIAIAAGWRWLINYDFAQIIVFHDSLLPKYRGFNPLVTALLNRDSEVGVTAIVANKDFDRGDVVDRRSIKINYPVKIADAINEVGGLYFDLLKSILVKIKSDGYLVGVPQDEVEASYSVWRDEEDYRINWQCSAETISHFVNCLSFPYKGASTICGGRLIRILGAGVEPDVLIENRDVGKVLFLIDNKPVVICGVGLLRIDVAVDDLGQSVLPFKSFRTRLK